MQSDLTANKYFAFEAEVCEVPKATTMWLSKGGLHVKGMNEVTYPDVSGIPQSKCLCLPSVN